MAASDSPGVLAGLRRRFLADARAKKRRARGFRTAHKVSEAYARFGNMGLALSADERSVVVIDP